LVAVFYVVAVFMILFPSCFSFPSVYCLFAKRTVSGANRAPKTMGGNASRASRASPPRDPRKAGVFQSRTPEVA
jgi:hypothetical protein